MALGYSAFNTPNGNVAPSFHDSKFNATFINTADFTCGANETCAHGEYRQLIKGTYTVAGSVVDHYLCRLSGTLISANDYRQDGCPPPGCSAYGYRSCPDHEYNRYTPARDTGCHYEMTDIPGFSGIASGVTYGLDLHFRGKLIDTSGPTDLVSKDWTVTGAGRAPTVDVTTKSASLKTDEPLMGAHVAINPDTSNPELHIVFTRPAGRAPLDRMAINVIARDSDGKEVSLKSPAVHEVAGRHHATATFLFSLSPARRLPATAEVRLRTGKRGLVVNVIHR